MSEGSGAQNSVANDVSKGAPRRGNKKKEERTGPRKRRRKKKQVVKPSTDAESTLVEDYGFLSNVQPPHAFAPYGSKPPREAKSRRRPSPSFQAPLVDSLSSSSSLFAVPKYNPPVNSPSAPMGTDPVFTFKQVATFDNPAADRADDAAGFVVAAEAVGAQEDSEDLERARWQAWAVHVMELERDRRLQELEQIEERAEEEQQQRRSWAIRMVMQEQANRVQEMFLQEVVNTQWFDSILSTYEESYEVMCPYSMLGCQFRCKLEELDDHFLVCEFCDLSKNDLVRQDPEETAYLLRSYEVMCPYARMGCNVSCLREDVEEHLMVCPYAQNPSREEEAQARIDVQNQAIADQEQERMRRVRSQLGESAAAAASARERAERSQLGEVPRVGSPIERIDNPKATAIHAHFMKQAEAALRKLNAEILEFADKCVSRTRSLRPLHDFVLQKLGEAVATMWVGSRVYSYGSYVTELMTPSSDVDIVVIATHLLEDNYTNWLRIRQLESCIRRNLPFIRIYNVIDTTSIPIIKAGLLPSAIPIIEQWAEDRSWEDGELTDVLSGLSPGGDVAEDEGILMLDISIHSIRHTGLANTAFVKYLMKHLPELQPLVLVLKFFLSKHRLHDVFHGGVPAYGLILMVTLLLLHEGRKGRVEPFNAHAVRAPEPRMHPKVFASSPLTGPGKGLPPKRPRSGSTPLTLPVELQPAGEGRPEELGEAGERGQAIVRRASPQAGRPGPLPGYKFMRRPSDPTCEKNYLEGADSNCPTTRNTVSYSSRVFATPPRRGHARHGSNPVVLDSMGDPLIQIAQDVLSEETPGRSSGEFILKSQLDVGFAAAVDVLRPIGIRPGREAALFTSTQVSSLPYMPMTSASPPNGPPLLLGSPGESPPLSPQTRVSSPMSPPRLSSSHSVSSLSSMKASSTRDRPILGKLLVDFFYFFGEEFDPAQEGFSVHSGGFRFFCNGDPPHPQVGQVPFAAHGYRLFGLAP